MIFKFYGFETIDVDELMPKVIKALDLGHPKYSTIVLEHVALHDEEGEVKEAGQVVEIPAFQKIREHPDLLAELSKLLKCPVTMIDAPVIAGIDGKLY